MFRGLLRLICFPISPGLVIYITAWFLRVEANHCIQTCLLVHFPWRFQLGPRARWHWQWKSLPSCYPFHWVYQVLFARGFVTARLFQSGLYLIRRKNKLRKGHVRAKSSFLSRRQWYLGPRGENQLCFQLHCITLPFQTEHSELAKPIA